MPSRSMAEALDSASPAFQRPSPVLRVTDVRSPVAARTTA